jgi:hypothetical protein
MFFQLKIQLKSMVSSDNILNAYIYYMVIKKYAYKNAYYANDFLWANMMKIIIEGGTACMI